MLFPNDKKSRVTDLWRWTFLLYGREKIGKSLTANSFPDVIFIPTEPGLKDIECRALTNSDGFIKNWSEFLEAIKCIEENKDKCKVVCIDTVDRAYDMCAEYICNELGIRSLGESSKGKKDFGVSWDRCKKEFLRTIHRLICVGKGVIFTSHAKSFMDDNKQNFILPTMSNKCREIVEPIVDYAFYGEEVIRNVQGKGLVSERVWLCKGNSFIWAGGRHEFPKFLPMLKENGYAEFEKAFNDLNYKGILDTEIIRSVEKSLAFQEVLK